MTTRIDSPYTYVTATREGLLVLDITDPSNMVEAPAAAATDLRTPGFASGVTVRRVNNGTTVIVGDNRGGLRLYKEPE